MPGQWVGGREWRMLEWESKSARVKAAIVIVVVAAAAAAAVVLNK